MDVSVGAGRRAKPLVFLQRCEVALGDAHDRAVHRDEQVAAAVRITGCERQARALSGALAGHHSLLNVAIVIAHVQELLVLVEWAAVGEAVPHVSQASMTSDACALLNVELPSDAVQPAPN